MAPTGRSAETPLSGRLAVSDAAACSSVGACLERGLARGRGLERGFELRITAGGGASRLGRAPLLAHGSAQRATRLHVFGEIGDQRAQAVDRRVDAALPLLPARLRQCAGGLGRQRLGAALQLLQDRVQVVTEGGRRRIARVGFLGQRSRQDGGQARADLPDRVERHGRRLLVDDLVEDLRRALAREGPVSGERLVEDDAGREDVAAPVQRAPAHLLGAHVVHRPHHHAGLGEVRAAELGDAEVHDLRAAVVEQADVARLDVAVHDAALMSVAEAAADLDQHVDLLAERQRFRPPQHDLEVGAGQQLHRDEGDATVLAELVDDDDVRVLQPRGGLGLDLEALAAVRVEAAVAGQRLERDLALEGLVSGPVDHPHPATADAARQQIAAHPQLARLGRLGKHAPTPRIPAARR